MGDVFTSPNTDARVQQLGRELWQRVQGEVPGIFNKGYWQGRILDWAMRDPSFKVDLFRFLDLIDNLVSEVSTWPPDPLIDRNHLGPIPRTNVSVKVSAMEAHLDAADPKGSVDRLMPRVLPLFLRAKERNVFLNVDLEQFSLSRITYDLFEEILMHPELRSWPHIGI